MDNNKTVDNLNFIKIYFRVFIYKIIVFKYLELSKKKKKEMKNHRQDENASGYKDRSKTLEEESKWHPNTKVHSEP